MNGKPVIALAPLDSHYHKKSTSLLGVEVHSWVHPFVEGLSDLIVPSLAAAARWIKEQWASGLAEIKGPEWIHEAMQYYITEQYSSDHPMTELAAKSASIHERLQSIEQQQMMQIR